MKHLKTFENTLPIKLGSVTPERVKSQLKKYHNIKDIEIRNKKIFALKDEIENTPNNNDIWKAFVDEVNKDYNRNFMRQSDDDINIDYDEIEFEFSNEINEIQAAFDSYMELVNNLDKKVRIKYPDKADDILNIILPV